VDDRRLDVFLRHAVQAGFYPTDGPNMQQLVTDSDIPFFWTNTIEPPALLTTSTGSASEETIILLVLKV